MKAKGFVLYFSLGVILFAIIFWYNVRYFAYNYPYIEQLDMFLFDSDYAVNRIFNIGGLMSYISAFITQFYINPYYGAAISSFVFLAMAIGVYGIWKKISLQQLFMPIFVFLPGITLLWVQTDFNYHWWGTFSVLLSLLVVNVYIRINSFWLRLLFMMFCSWSGYYISGSAIFTAVFAAVIYDIYTEKKSGKWISLINIPFSILLPYILYKSGMFINLSQAFSFDMYYNSQLGSKPLHYYVVIAILLNVLLAVVLNRFNYKRTVTFSVLSIVLQVVIAGYILHKGTIKYNPLQNYYAKQLDYYTRTGQWQEILDFKELRPGQNYMHACYQNLALAELGILGNKLLKFRQSGPRGLVISWNKSLNSSMLLSDVFHKMGNVALSQEMAFEGLVGTESSMNPRMLMRLVQTNIIMGHYKVADKYISMLMRTLFYKDKAKYYSKIVENPELIDNDHELSELRKCIKNTSGLINSETFADGLYKIITNYPEYNPALEYLGSLCLLSKNIQAFNILADEYLKIAKPMPLYFQEAYIMMHEKETEEQWKKYGISESVISRFKNYCSDVLTLRKNGGSIAFALKNKYADTYWFYFMFAQ